MGLEAFAAVLRLAPQIAPRPRRTRPRTRQEQRAAAVLVLARRVATRASVDSSLRGKRLRKAKRALEGASKKARL